MRMFLVKRRHKRTRHRWSSRWWSSCVFPGVRTDTQTGKRLVKRAKNNSETGTGRLRKNKMENQGHKAAPPHWLKGTQDGHY